MKKFLTHRPPPRFWLKNSLTSKEIFSGWAFGLVRSGVPRPTRCADAVGRQFFQEYAHSRHSYWFFLRCNWISRDLHFGQKK